MSIPDGGSPTHRIIGLLESACEHDLWHEFDQHGFAYTRQVNRPSNHDGAPLDSGYLAEISVNNDVLLELKSVEHILPLHEARHLSQRHAGLLRDVNTLSRMDGIRPRVLQPLMSHPLGGR
jgi:GxxExxY protein